MVEISSQELPANHIICELLSSNNRIQRACALLTPGVWGSNNLSYRYPKHPDFPRTGIQMLTDKAVPYRYRMRGRLSRGRYAVPVGTVYVFKQPLNKTWWEFPDEWFPDKGLLKKMGCGLCLPVAIEGLM